MTTGLVLDSVADDVRFSAPALAAVTAPALEIRLLGPFQVRRHDGTIVDRGEWRTGKVSDLLRLLALRNGEPVSPTTLVAALWPGSDQRHGNASLRTAASHLRRIVGAEFLERSLAGIRLCNVRVDVAEFRELAAKAHQLTGRGEIVAADNIARQADDLYRGDLSAHDDGADWVQNERGALLSTYQVLLCDAAESAGALGLGQDAVDFASRAVALDPFSERASRLLMSGHADVGELSLALREYERCRTLLADELGIDPSPQTRDLHVALLRDRRYAPKGAIVQRPVHTTAPADRVREPRGHQEGQHRPAASPLTTARDYLLRRDLPRARRLADDAARMTTAPDVQARAIVMSWLPDILLGAAREARDPVAQATRLAATAGNRLLSSRIAVLNCLVAHDIGTPDFAAQWARAADSCEVESDVNWAWLMMRIAVERDDLRTAQLARRLPVAETAGPLSTQLHSIASASLLAAQGDTQQAVDVLTELLATLEGAAHHLLLPETLARLAALEALGDVGRAERYIGRLDGTIDSRHLFPREAFLRSIAIAAIHSARARTAAAAAAAARAAEIAEANGLHQLTTGAHELCAQYTSRAQSAAAHRAFRGSLRLTLSMVAV